MERSFLHVVFAACIAILAVATPTLLAEEVEFFATGVVNFNSVTAPPVAAVNPGDVVTLSFLLDSDVFQDVGTLRGYEVDLDSYCFQLGSLEVDLQDPFPNNPPHFVMQNLPSTDGCYVGSSFNFPDGLPLDVFGALRNNFWLSFLPDEFDSLDLLAAIGTYDLASTDFRNWSLDDGPPVTPNPLLGIDFTEMTLSVVQSEPTFIRGDGDGDGAFNGLADGLFVLAHQFQGGPAPICMEAGDADGDGTFNGLIDGLHILAHQFQGGPPPPAPYPLCGIDPEPGASLGCAVNGCP